ncbi:unnamed protein product [Urochloa decumbens]|uniref:Gnk2-homologous domain-containing protein n=1 Tax=Urochloa decumbens TaxID=240449 RepID=A0ABC9BIF2_9POAL
MALASSSTRAPPLFLPSIIMLFLLLLLASSPSQAAFTPAVPIVTCNANSYRDGDPFAASLAQLLQEMVWSPPWTAGGDVYKAVPSQAPLVYGHAVCRPVAGENDCKLCINYATTRMQEICEHSVGGRAVQAGDCMVRYENYAFTD